jgi:hypothetical protein
MQPTLESAEQTERGSGTSRPGRRAAARARHRGQVPARPEISRFRPSTVTVTRTRRRERAPEA